MALIIWLLFLVFFIFVLSSSKFRVFFVNLLPCVSFVIFIFFVQIMIIIFPGKDDSKRGLPPLIEMEDNGEAALAALEKAASLEETPSYYHYVYAVAQHDQGRPTEALATLKATNRAAPGQPNVLVALVQYSQLAGDMQAAQRYQTELRNTALAAGVQ